MAINKQSFMTNLNSLQPVNKQITKKKVVEQVKNNTAINKQSFLKGIVNKIKDKVNLTPNNLTYEMMKTEYPELGSTTDAIREKRFKQTRDLIKQGNYIGARTNLKNLSAKFKKDNPLYMGK